MSKVIAAISINDQTVIRLFRTPIFMSLQLQCDTVLEDGYLVVTVFLIVG